MVEINAPVAKKQPKTLEKHGDVRVDQYYWMNQREDPDVLAHLRAENDYFASVTEHTLSFRTKLFEEMKGRIKEDDSSVPYKNNGYWYITRFEKGQQYPIYARKKAHLHAEEEIMFNGNLMAKGHDFFNIGGLSISPDNSLATFGIDVVSRRQYTLQVKNLKTGEVYSFISVALR